MAPDMDGETGWDEKDAPLDAPLDAVAGEKGEATTRDEAADAANPDAARAGGAEDAAAEAPKAFLFDVFGTVVDWRTGVAMAVADAFAAKGIETDPTEFAEAWRRAYQPAMQPIRDGSRGYVALDDLHRENLETVLAAHDLSGAFDGLEIAALARAWEKLPPWPDVHLGLGRLRRLAPVAPCSNGSIALMVHLARFAGLEWDCVLGADIARSYKPEASVYLSACAALRIAPEQAVMVACHPDDLEAAAEAGLRTAYVLRPMEWGEAHLHDRMPLAVAAGRFDVAAEDFEALAARFGG